MHTDVDIQTAPILRHTPKRTYTMHPITFSIQAHHIRPFVPPKGQPLATVIPGNLTTYVFTPKPDSTPAQLAQLERDYFVDMQRSLFGVTWKKAGWDCLRHLELLASGCLPLFTDIASAPPGTLALYPKKVLQLVLEFPGVEELVGVPGAGQAQQPPPDRRIVINADKVDPRLYSATVNALLDYTRQRLSSEAVAAYMLTRMGVAIRRPRPWYDADGDGGTTDKCTKTRHAISHILLAMDKQQKNNHRHVSLINNKQQKRVSGTDRTHHHALHTNDAHRKHALHTSDDHELHANEPHNHHGLHANEPHNHHANNAHNHHASRQSVTRVLFLAMPKDTVDYMTDTLLPGFKTLLGASNVVDYHSRTIVYQTPATLFEREWAPRRTHQYGGGFTYAHSMLYSDNDTSAVVDESALRQRIADRDFDVVVLALVHRGRPPLLDDVCAHYPRSRVAVVHGHDRPPTNDELDEYDACAEYQFVREAY